MAEPVPHDSAATRTPWRHRLRVSFARRGVLITSAVGLLVVGGAAAATTILTTYTGQYTSGRQVQTFGSGQFLRIGGAGFCQAADKLAANIPYPTGERQAWVDWSLLVDVGTTNKITINELCGSNGQLIHSADAGTGGDETTSSVQGMFAQSAFCAWSDAWLRAKASGDTATAASAATEIAGALQWPASKAYDPNPIARFMTGNVVEGSLLGWFIPVQKAVQAEDVTSVKSLFAAAGNWQDGPVYAGECPGYMPNAGSDNGTVLTRAMLSGAAENANVAASGGF